MPIHNLHAQNQSRRGFSLVELAIVLGVIGVLTSAIWIYASSALEKTHVQQLEEEITTVVNNVQSLYAGQAGIGGPASYALSVVTPLLINQNAIPSTMLRPVAASCTNTGSLCADTPWGSKGNVGAGTFGVCAWTAGVPVLGPSACSAPAPAGSEPYFAIEVSGLTFDSCSHIAPSISGSGGPAGLQDVVINGAGSVAAGGLPVPVTFATANCAVAAPATVDFVYRLHPGSF